MTSAISDQLPDDRVLHPAQEVLQALWIQLSRLEQVLLRCWVLRFRLGTRLSSGQSLDLSLGRVDSPGLTASLEHTHTHTVTEAMEDNEP